MNALIHPPLSLFLCVALGLLVARKRRRSGLWIAGLSAALLVILCTPICASLLLGALESGVLPVDETRTEKARAIVVLGADMEAFAPEYGGATVGALTLERLRYAVRLQRRTALPIMTSGGVLRAGTPPLGRMMQGALEEGFGAQVRWVEAESRNTFENARLSAEMLHAEGIERIYLVTHAWHMRRAVREFEQAGIEVHPAPTGFHVRPRPELGDFLPSAKGLRQSTLALHEWLGLLWYSLQ